MLKGFDAAVQEDNRPSLYLTSEEVPVIKGWKVGGKYSLKVDVEEVSMTKDRGGLLSASFRIDNVAEDDDSNEDEEDDGGE